MKPLVTMPDVLLACGELNKRERVAVQWVIDRYERERSAGLMVDEVIKCLPGATERGQLNEKWLRENLTAAIAAKSRKDEV